MTNVAAGAAATDAVNVSQLQSALSAVGTGSTDGVQYDTSAHDKVTLGGTGAAVTLSNVGEREGTNGRSQLEPVEGPDRRCERQRDELVRGVRRGRREFRLARRRYERHGDSATLQRAWQQTGRCQRQAIERHSQRDRWPQRLAVVRFGVTKAEQTAQATARDSIAIGGDSYAIADRGLASLVKSARAEH